MCCCRPKPRQHCRVNRQKSTCLFSGDRFGCSHCLCVVVGGIPHFNVCILRSYIFDFLQWLTSLHRHTLIMAPQFQPLCVRKGASLLPYLSSTTVCPLLLVSSMMIFSSSGKSICTSFRLEPGETGTWVERINSSTLTFTEQVTEILLLHSRSKWQESVHGITVSLCTQEISKKRENNISRRKLVSEFLLKPCWIIFFLMRWCATVKISHVK